MIDQIKKSPNWRHLSYKEYGQFIRLFDKCPCEKSAIGLYIKTNNSKEFCVMCYTCNSFVYADYYLESMLMWNKKCRYKTGQKTSE